MRFCLLALSGMYFQKILRKRRLIERIENLFCSALCEEKRTARCSVRDPVLMIAAIRELSAGGKECSTRRASKM